MLITTGSQKDKLAIKLIPQMQHMNRQRSLSILRTNLPRFIPKIPKIPEYQTLSGDTYPLGKIKEVISLRISWF